MSLTTPRAILRDQLAVDDRPCRRACGTTALAAAFAGDHDLVGGAQRFAAEPRVHQAVVGDAELDVVLDEGVENGVGNLVADLVWVAFGDRFAGEKIIRRAPRIDTPPQSTTSQPRRVSRPCFLQCQAPGQDVGTQTWARVARSPTGPQRVAAGSFFAGDLLDEIDDAPAQLGFSIRMNDLVSAARRRWRGSRTHRPARAPPHAVLACTRPTWSARLRRRMTPAPAGYSKSAAAGWRRCGWCPSRISAPAGTSGRVRRRASPGSSLSIIRRMRTRDPTCLSIGLGAFLAIITISYVAPLYRNGFYFK